MAMYSLSLTAASLSISQGRESIRLLVADIFKVLLNKLIARKTIPQKQKKDIVPQMRVLVS